MAGDEVLGKAVAPRVADADAQRQLVGNQRSGRASLERPLAIVAERHGRPAPPALERWAGARYVHQTAQRVPSKQRALRSAYEFNLTDVDQLDARRVRVQLRYAVEVGRHARVARTRADATEARVAQLPRAEFVEEGVRCQLGGIADALNTRGLQRLARHRRHADGHFLDVLRLLLRCDRHGRQAESNGSVVVLSRRRGRLISGVLSLSKRVVEHSEPAADRDRPRKGSRLASKATRDAHRVDRHPEIVPPIISRTQAS